MDTLIKDYALITGATGGLGKAFAFDLAQRGYSLILTGRSEEKLALLQANICNKYPAIQTYTIAADLSNEESRYALMRQIKERDLRISMLVNVAGVDVQKPIREYTQEKLILQCRVNLEAAICLSRFVVEQRAQRLQILNISSVCGIYPMPYFAVYSATKSALISFSLSLREELKGKNAHVTAILPGAMPTREDIQQQIRGQGLWGKLAAKSPSFVVRSALNAVEKNKSKVVIGFWNKVMRAATALLPLTWKIKWIARRWSKISKDAF